MSRSLSAREMWIEFLTLVVAIFLFTFCFFYFILGYRLGLAEDIVRVLSSFSIFGLLLILEEKLSKREKERRKRASWDDIIVGFSKADKRKDVFAIIIMTAVLVLLGRLGDGFNTTDTLQVILFIILSYAWHLFLFRRKDVVGSMNLTVMEKRFDGIFIFVLATIIISVPLLKGVVDAYDQIQAVFVFVAMHYWHKYIFQDFNL